MTEDRSPPFAFCLESDAYSTAGRIMGRQAAGKGFLRGLGRTWPKAVLQGIVTGNFDRGEIRDTLRESGFRGELRLTNAPEFLGARRTGALYYPTIPVIEMARFRNRLAPAAYSIFGVTHTISSDRALDGIAALAGYPFMPWDALICTSQAAKQVADAVIEETQDDLRRHTGAVRLESVQTPVIPLGVHCDSWDATEDGRAQARARLGLAPDEVAFLFAGRLSFHAKANPAPLYQALQEISGVAKLVLIEAGLFSHDGVRDAFRRAQADLAPDVRFIHAPGDDAEAYADAWRAADVFTSLSDNVQETFGLTPVEAMAAGLPLVVSDWNGYRSNIRHGLDGFLIPTIAAPPGAGEDVGLAVASRTLDYNQQIGLLSLAVTVDRRALREALTALATDADLRARMGAAGRLHAEQVFDWPVVLRRYDALAKTLAERRAADADRAPVAWPARADSFARFEGFATRTTQDQDLVVLSPAAEALLATVKDLVLANYGFHPAFLDAAAPEQLLAILQRAPDGLTVEALLAAAGGPTPPSRRALAWLFKFGVVEIG